MLSSYRNCLLLGTNARTLINFRGDLVKSLSNKNLHVILSSSKPDFSDLDVLKHLGNVEYRTIHLEKSGLKFYSDIKTLVNINSLIKKYKPRFILAYGIKLVIWGGVAARVTNTQFYALITGLGFAFQGQSTKRRLLTKLVSFLYKVALRNSKAIIFQNEDNLNFFIDKGIVPRSKTHIVNGSGVDIEKFYSARFLKSDVCFLCVSRLLGEKGLREYAVAARIVKKKYPNVKFDLVGPQDLSPDAISLSEVSSWSDCIDYKGSTSDVRKYIKACHVFILPSYHEGLPRSTLEAMSMGRPILTTNATGCKETVKEGINGFMVPIGSSKELAVKMIWYIENKDKIQSMGEESRKIVEKRFDVRKVNKEMMRILGVE